MKLGVVSRKASRSIAFCESGQDTVGHALDSRAGPFGPGRSDPRRRHRFGQGTPEMGIPRPSDRRDRRVRRGCVLFQGRSPRDDPHPRDRSSGNRHRDVPVGVVHPHPRCRAGDDVPVHPGAVRPRSHNHGSPRDRGTGEPVPRALHPRDRCQRRDDAAGIKLADHFHGEPAVPGGHRLVAAGAAVCGCLASDSRVRGRLHDHWPDCESRTGDGQRARGAGAGGAPSQARGGGHPGEHHQWGCHRGRRGQRRLQQPRGSEPARHLGSGVGGATARAGVGVECPGAAQGDRAHASGKPSDTARGGHRPARRGVISHRANDYEHQPGRWHGAFGDGDLHRHLRSEAHRRVAPPHRAPRGGGRVVGVPGARDKEPVGFDPLVGRATGAARGRGRAIPDATSRTRERPAEPPPH